MCIQCTPVQKQRVLHMLLPPTTIFTTFSTFVYTRPDISTHIEKKKIKSSCCCVLNRLVGKNNYFVTVH